MALMNLLHALMSQRQPADADPLAQYGMTQANTSPQMTGSLANVPLPPQRPAMGPVPMPPMRPPMDLSSFRSPFGAASTTAAGPSMHTTSGPSLIHKFMKMLASNGDAAIRLQQNG